MSRRQLVVIGLNGTSSTMVAGGLGSNPILYMITLEAKVPPNFLRHAGRNVDLWQLTAKRSLTEGIGRARPC